jgi:Sec-independent protein secretion pathway component TatC
VLLKIELLFLAFAAYIILQLVSLRVLRGHWRSAAVVSAVIGALISAYTIVAFILASNLWPLMLLLSAPWMLLYVVALLVLNALAGATSASNGNRSSQPKP